MNPNEVVYISNIPKEASLAELQSFLRSSGNVIGVAFMRENRNDCRTKIAFVLFEDELQAAEACNLDQTLFQNHRLSVLLSNDDRKFCAGFTIAIQNTSSDTSEEDLFEACCRYGNVEAVQIPTNFYAFVGFTERSAAHAAQRKLHNSILKKQKVSVKVLDEDMRVRLEDLDSFKSPRVYNELLRAKRQYNAGPSMPPTNQREGHNMHQGDFAGPSTGHDHRQQQHHHQQQHHQQEHQQQQYQQPYDDDDYDYRNRDQDQGSGDDEQYDRYDMGNQEEDGDDGYQDGYENTEWVDFGDDFESQMDHDDNQDNAHFDEQPSADGMVVSRNAIKFGKPIFKPSDKNSVKFENIPREVSDEDVVIFCQSMGPIVSVEKGTSMMSIFGKSYTVIYHDEASQKRAIEIFRRPVTLSGVSFSIFAMIPGEMLHSIYQRSLLLSYLSHQTRLEDIADAFSHVGDVMYMQRSARNNGPTVVHFRHNINIEMACSTTMLEHVTIVPVTRAAIQNFIALAPKFKKHLRKIYKGAQKSKYLRGIEAKENRERRESIIIRTAHDPLYRNPDPSKYQFEVVLYNCPEGITFAALKKFFQRAAEPLTMRHEPNPFDATSWKVYISFSNYLDAFRAARLKGKLNGRFIFKHIATETPRLDTPDAAIVTFKCAESVNLKRLVTLFGKSGDMCFAEQIGRNEFILIFRNMGAVAKFHSLKLIDRSIKITSTKKFIQKHQEPRIGDGPPSRAFTILSNVLDQYSNKAIKRMFPKTSRAVQQQASTSTSVVEAMNKQPMFEKEPPAPPQQPKEQSVPEIRVTINQDTATGEPIRDVKSSNTPELKAQEAERRESPQPIGSNSADDDLRSLIEKRTSTKLSDLEEMERYIKQKEEDIRRRLEKLEQDEASVSVSMLLPSSSRRSRSPDQHSRNSRRSDSHRRSRSRSRSPPPSRTESSTGVHRASTSGMQPGPSSSHSSVSGMPVFAGTSNRSESMDRAGSPSERLAHERFVQIRMEKIAICRELNSLHQRFSAQKSSRMRALESRQSELDREQRAIQLQLEVKHRMRMQDDPSCFVGTSFDRTPSPASRYLPGSRSRSRSRSPYPRRSLSRSRSDTRIRSRSRSYYGERSRSRSTERSIMSRKRHASRSPSPPYRSPSAGRRRPSSRSRSPIVRRPASLSREMYSVGQYDTAHHKHSVYVGNIDGQVTPEELSQVFMRYGPIDDIDFQRFERYREVYIDYREREDLGARTFALDANDLKLCGRRLRVAFNGEKPSNREGYTLHIVPKCPVAEETIYQTFEPYGKIEFIWYPEGSLFGCVSFRRTEFVRAAQEVYELVDGTPVKVRPFRKARR